MKTCKEIFCNIGCKNTMFEEGKTLSNGFMKKQKIDKDMKSIYENIRKKIFGNKSNVLKDNFYEKLSQKKYPN